MYRRVPGGGRIQGAAEGAARSWLSTRGRGSLPAPLRTFKPQSISVLLLRSQWLFLSRIQASLLFHLVSVLSLPHLGREEVPQGLATFFFVSVEISAPHVSVPRRVKITAWLWLGHTSDFTTQKLSDRAIHLLLSVYHCACFRICISAPPVPLGRVLTGRQA